MMYSTLFLLTALSSVSSAFDPAKDTSCNEQGICLSSFVWCDGRGKACSYPEGADALIPGNTAASYAVLYHGAEYEIRWRQAEPGTDVLVEWLFDGSPFLKGEERLARELPVMWSTNVRTPATEGTFIFDPFSILKGFPTSHARDMSPEEAASAAGGIANTIRFSQPGSGFPEVYTDQFTVQSSWAHELVKNVRQQETDLRSADKHKMRLGVGIGVGLGVPLLSGLMWWAASKHASSRATLPVLGK
ncbi:hypothetical protein QBC37DRAFT_316328 [Rhypophila decipiens]|uniref:Uncharacterized protein n=1 Tax=Rhypophila decipiens TaxID=261697 RepID=A0AAN6Y6K4_9PEZI|nr:hypothetical protein QBC37DRAFT_316328 [Rhypophila decipiens]